MVEIRGSAIANRGHSEVASAPARVRLHRMWGRVLEKVPEERAVAVVAKAREKDSLEPRVSKVEAKTAAARGRRAEERMAAGKAAANGRAGRKVNRGWRRAQPGL